MVNMMTNRNGVGKHNQQQRYWTPKKVYERATLGYLGPMKKTTRWPLPTTPVWRAALRDVLEERGRGSQHALATAIGVNPSLISKLVSGRHQVSSVHVAEISAWAGIAPPSITPEEAAWVDAGRALHELAPKHYEELLTFARNLVNTMTSAKKDINDLDD